MKKLNILRALIGAPLSALILPLVLAGFLASCDDGYLPTTPHITFDRETLYLDDRDEDNNLIPLTITVSIPSKLMNTQFSVTWDGLDDGAGNKDIDKVRVWTITKTTDEDGVISEDVNIETNFLIDKTTNFFVKPIDEITEADFTLYITVYKLTYDEDENEEKEVLTTSEVTFSVIAEKPGE
jgi:hypothetical protein